MCIHKGPGCGLTKLFAWFTLYQARNSILGLALTHWGLVTHICVSKVTIIGSDNGLSSGRRQAIICTNAVTLLIGPSGTNFSKILTNIHTFSFKKMYLKMSSENGGHFVSLIIVTKWVKQGSSTSWVCIFTVSVNPFIRMLKDRHDSCGYLCWLHF